MGKRHRNYRDLVNRRWRRFALSFSSQGEQAKGPSAPSDYLLEPRDKTECALIEASKYNEMPVLGICRGLQQINLFHGGSLTPVEEHVALEHELASCNDDKHIHSPNA